MGCPESVIIGKNLVFSITTHDPDTGVATDADAVPQYRIYEDVNEAAILTGNMDDGTGPASQFNNADTTGFYMKQIACTAGNGFREGRTYTIYIDAVVDGDQGSISYAFTARVVDDFLDVAGAIDGATLRAAIRYIAAVLAGDLSGARTGTETVFGLDGTPRVRSLVDSRGNRISMTYDP